MAFYSSFISCLEKMNALLISSWLIKYFPFLYSSKTPIINLEATARLNPPVPVSSFLDSV